jgi:hypothetical protein
MLQITPISHTREQIKLETRQECAKKDDRVEISNPATTTTRNLRNSKVERKIQGIDVIGSCCLPFFGEHRLTVS